MDIMVSELIQLGMNMNDNKNEIQNKLIEINSKELLEDLSDNQKTKIQLILT